MGEARCLIITADDFGLSAEVNAAVAELAAAGRVGATSLLVRAPHAQAALDLEVGIAVGLHVQLDRAELAATSAQVEVLIEDQVAWMVERNARPTHIDLHTAALYGLGPDAPRPGGVLAEALAVAARHRLPLRLPRTPPTPLSPALVDAHAVLVARADQAGVELPEVILTDTRPADRMDRAFDDVAGGTGCVPLGEPASGTLDAVADSLAQYVGLLEQVPTGCSELFTHPARPPAGGDTDSMTRKRVIEYEMLRSGQLHDAAATAGIEVRTRHTIA